MNPNLSIDYDNPHQLAIETAPPGLRSVFSGYKIMDSGMENSMKHMSIDPGLRTSMEVPDPSGFESSRVYHFDGPGLPLRPGNLLTGGPTSVQIPPDIDKPSARVYLHTHENIPDHPIWEPSVHQDIENAREYQNVQHGVLAAPERPGYPPVPILFSGANPPHHYIGLENPDPARFQPALNSPDLTPSPGGTPRYPEFKEKPAGWDEAMQARSGPPQA